MRQKEMTRGPVCPHTFDRAAAVCRRLSGLAAIVLASACSRTGLDVAEEDYGANFGSVGQDAAVLGGSDSGDEGSPGLPSGPPDSAIAEDGGCSTSVLTYEPPDPTFGACWTCAKTGCSSQLTACSADCACNMAIAGALTCVDKGGAALPCFASTFSSAPGDSALSAVSGCLTMVANECACQYSGQGPSVDAAPPTASDDASAACTPLSGNGNGSTGGGLCDSNYSARCGGTTYQVSCTCPAGMCACYGPTTHVISFTGCPYCPSDGPSAPGPTTIEQVFTLCGFGHF